MNIIGVIPARMASSRYPGKPMANILGMPMIGHVYYRSKMCDALKEVYVATCDKEIFDYIISIDGKAVMTSSLHERASDRVAEAMLKVEGNSKELTDIVVMIQGDEPMVFPEMINDAIEPLIENKETDVVNLMAELLDDEINNPNVVKVVADLRGYALYFSREAIPSLKKYKGKAKMYKQVPIIPFRRDYLIEYNQLEQTPLEVIESVDMLRVLENGSRVLMVESQHITFGVDTIEDLQKVERFMSKDVLFDLYR